MALVRLEPDEADILGTIINSEFDGIDLYPGDLDPSALMVATLDVESVMDGDGVGDLPPVSARLVLPIIAFFGDLEGAEDAAVTDAFRRLLEKLEAVAASGGT